MDHPSEETIVILSMDICCVPCQNKLEKKILKIAGARKVNIYVNENLVSVIGRMDMATLLGSVEKAGKRVKVLSCEKYTEKDKFHGNSNVRMGGGHGCCGHEVRSHEVRHEHKEEEEHKRETYVPPSRDDRICRSYYCPDHQKLRKLLHRVPEESSTFLGGGLYSGCDGYCGGGPCNPYGYPQGYNTNRPMYPLGYPNMTQFGHSQPPRNMSQFGHHSQPSRMRPFGFL